MRREGSKFSDSRGSVFTNATIRRSAHLLCHLPDKPFFILPEGMSIATALTKAQKARQARHLFSFCKTNSNLSATTVAKLDDLDFKTVASHQLYGRYLKSLTTYDELTRTESSYIRELAAQWPSVLTDTVSAANRIMERHKRLEAESQQLESLGYGSGRILATLTKRERERLEEQATSDWVNVQYDNLYVNEEAAVKARTRLIRKIEASSKVDTRWKSRAERNPHGVERAMMRSEMALKV